MLHWRVQASTKCLLSEYLDQLLLDKRPACTCTRSEAGSALVVCKLWHAACVLSMVVQAFPYFYVPYDDSFPDEPAQGMAAWHGTQRCCGV